MASQEDFLFAEHVLRRGFATEEQVQECLKILDRLKEEMQLEETLAGLLLKKGFIAPAQATVVDHDIHPERAAAAKNQIQGYRLLSRLGAGAMGSVYKAWHGKLDIPVALKVLRADLAANRTQVERLKREAQLAARLGHPNIVRSLDVGESNGFHYVAMEFVDGQTARELIEKRPLREKEALRIVREVAKALEHAHAQGVVHRDVKPGNIMITKEGGVKLADFGLARGQQPSELTLEHASIGTPQYLAPEQARRGADATHRSDLFSLGATLYHLVAGRPPFEGDNLGEIFGRVLRCDYDPPESVAPHLGLDTVYLIHRLMRPRAKDRYADATELLRDIERLERGERIAPSDFRGDFREFAERRRRRRVALAAAGGATAVALAALAFALLRQSGAERERIETCRALDRTLEREVDEATGAGVLRGHLHRMREAAAAGRCAPEELSGLALRIRECESDVRALEEADRLSGESLSPKADFRALARRAEGLAARFAGTRAALASLRSALVERSREAAQARQREVYSGSYGRPEAAERELEDLDAELQTRFLPLDEEWAGRVREHALSFRALRAAFEAAEAAHGRPFRLALEGEDFALADEQISALLRKQTEARRTANVPAQFLAAFPAEDPRVAELKEAEREAFAALRRKVEGSLASRPEEAAALVRNFRPSAETLLAREELRKSVDSKGSLALEEQRRDLRIAESAFFALLEEGRLRAASKGMREARKARESWVPEVEERFSLLGRIGAELERVVERLPGAAAPDAADPDLHPVGGGERRSLREIPWMELEGLLAFDEGKPGEAGLRGHFRFAAALCREDRRETCVLLERACGDLRATDAGAAAEAARRLEEERRAQEEREKEAAALFRDLLEADKRGDYDAGHIRCRELLERLRFTDRTEASRTQIEGLRDKYDQLGGGQVFVQRSGIPHSQFRTDPSTGRTTIEYDFRVWHPYEGKVPKERLDETTRNYWKAVHDALADPRKPAFEKFLERAKHQLLDFGAEVTPHPSGGALFSSAEQQDRWWKGTPPLPAGLANHFDGSRDWSLELLVDFESGAPVYFAIGAGRVEAGIVWQEDPRWPKLARRAARIFLVPGDRKRIEEEAARARPPGAEFPPLSARGTTVRLERRGDQLLLFASPEGAPPAGPIETFPIPAEERRALDGFGRFQIHSHEACRLRRVVASGTLRSAARGEEGRRE